MSEPVAIGTMPLASATPEPPDEPAADLEVERIAGRAIDGVAGVGAGAPFRRVGLAEHVRAGRGIGDDALVLGRDMSSKIGLPEVVRRPAASSVLHAERQAVQRAELIAAHRRFSATRAAASAPVIARHHRVDGGVDRLDPAMQL